MPVELSRREFLQTGVMASGLILAIQLPAYARNGLDQLAKSTAVLSPHVFLQITPDGAVVLWLTKSEMGQGVRTSLPMIVAEELEVPLDTIRVQQATADPKFGEQGTGGSSSVRRMWGPLRTASAQAREMLIGAASRTWGVPAGECAAESGAVIHAASGRRAGYGELVAIAAALKVPDNPRLKDPKSFRLIGRSTPQLDGATKVDGSARYGIDTRLPGMVFACVARCPVFGRHLTGHDANAARAVPGVLDVVPLEAGELLVAGIWKYRLPGAVAVVAENSWAAMQGCKALDCRWDGEGGLSSAGLSRLMHDRAAQAGTLGRNDGDAAVALAGAGRLVEATYAVPFLAHAPMEPMNCTAHVRAGRCDVYVPTQSQTDAQQLVEQLTGLPTGAVTIHTTLLGGGFGRRFGMDWVIDAVRVSKAVSRPVQVVWTREDDLQHDDYRPASYHVLRAGLSQTGDLIAWTHRVVAPSIIAWHAPAYVERPDQLAEEVLDGAADLPYAIPNLRVDYCQVSTPVPVGWWRSVWASQNCFANECFLDEIARATRRDPYELRRALLGGSPRFLRVLELAADKAGWSTAPAAGRTRGIAIHKLFNDTIVAEVAEVSVDPGGVRVHRVVCAVDCGRVVNPGGLAAQIEGSVVYGLSAALGGAITLENGRVKQSNFHDYPVLRMSGMPWVEVHVVESSEDPKGVGEPAVPPLAPAVANAVAAATGKPIRSLPLTLG